MAFLTSCSFVRADEGTLRGQWGTRRRKLGKTYQQTIPRRSLIKANLDSGDAEQHMSAREAEIAGKIARLKNRKGLSPDRKQPSPDAQSPNNTTGNSATSKTNSAGYASLAFADLPDWKKEEVLLQEMESAESFLKTRDNSAASNTSASNANASPVSPKASTESPDSTGKNETSSVYRPKVQTWGIFPRTDNVSRDLGGGRTVPLGGRSASPDDPATREREQRTKDLLSRYRASQGIDMEREQANEPAIAAAMERATAHTVRARPYDAVRELESVLQYVSPRSGRGGEVNMQLALAYEATGQREKAKALYLELRKSPFPAVARQAKQLLGGLDAMQMLNMEDDTANTGYRVGKFQLPDVAQYTDKRYETVILPSRKREPTTKAAEADDGQSPFAGQVLTALVVLIALFLPVLLVVQNTLRM